MAIRERTIHVNWEISGQSELQDSNDVIEGATAETEQLAGASEEAGAEMTEAGEKGASSFGQVETSLEGVNAQLGAVAAGSGAVAAAGGVFTQQIAEAAGNLEQANTLVQSLGGPGASMIRQEAQELEEASNSFFTVGEILDSAGNLLFGGALEPSQVAQLIDPLSTLATVSPEFDLTRLVEQVGEVLREGETIGQLAEMGFTRSEVEIFGGGQFGENIDSVRKLAEAQGKQAAQQLIINELTRSARQIQQAANDVLQTFNSRWAGLTNELGNLEEELGKGILPLFTDGIEKVQEWSEAIRDSETISLAFIGKLGVMITGFAFLTAVVIGGIFAFSAFGAVAGIALLPLLALIAAISLFVVLAIDLISVLFGGKGVFLNWEKITKSLANRVRIAVFWWKKMVGIPIAEFFTNAWNEAKRIVGLLVEFVTSGKILEAGVMAMKTLADGFKEGGKFVIDQVKILLRKVRDFLPFSDAKKGPFSNLTEAGAAIPETMSKGIEMKAPEMTQSFNQIAEQTAPTPSSARTTGGGKEITVRIVDETDGNLSRRNIERLAEELGPELRKEAGVEFQGMS